MDLDQFFGENIILVLNKIKEKFDYVEYSKHEQEEYINVVESGFFLYAKEGGVINSFRVYLVSVEGFGSSPKDLRSTYSSIESLDDVVGLFGDPRATIRSISIPGIPPTFPGYLYFERCYKIAFHYRGEDGKIVSIQKTDLRF